MNFATIIGLLAATCTTISFVPQVVQILKTKNTKGISLGMYILFTFGIACWLIYGFYLGELPIIIANAITLVLASTILVFKIKHG
ncbi:MAG: SemiSWEET transporter [Bacteroidetes bacterium]|jgi:MtN3 and saliva related transmembrane protein|nr:SemiSWEET transporter [Bacteroidota bacterium]